MGGIGESKDMRKLSIAAVFFSTALAAGTAGADVVIDNQTIPGADISSISISPSTGHLFVTTIPPGYTVTKNGDPPPPPPPGQVAVNTLTATPATLDQGATTTIAWTTTNAVSCTPTGGTAEWQSTTITPLASGNKVLTMATPGNYLLTLTCNGDGADNTASKTVSVTVNSTDPNTCPTPPLAGNTQTWSSFWGVNWPSPVYDNRFLTIPRFGYVAIKFNTGNVSDDGRLITIESTQTDGIRFGTVTQCPGDFSATVPSACKKTWGLGGSIRWATNGVSGACQLLPNKDYYFNVTFTDGNNPLVSTCSKTPCITTIQHNNF